MITIAVILGVASFSRFSLLAACRVLTRDVSGASHFLPPPHSRSLTAKNKDHSGRHGFGRGSPE
jgi:hypothetical protein